FFMTAGDPLGALVSSVVDERFVQRAEARAGVGGDVFEAERLEHIHHEIGPGVLDRERIGDIDVRRYRPGLGRQLAGRRRRSRPAQRLGSDPGQLLWLLGPQAWNRRDDRGCSGSRAGSGAFQKATAVNTFSGFHGTGSYA